MVETIIANLISFAIALAVVLPAMFFYIVYDVRKRLTKAYRLSKKHRGIKPPIHISSHAKCVAALNGLPTTPKRNR